MNTQGIGNSSSWENFVRLTEEARMRNSSTEVKATKQVSVRKPLDNGGMIMPGAKNISGQNTTFLTGAPKVQSRILGGMFDTYA